MLLKLFSKLVDRGISLLRERETRRVNCFREVVQPVHEVFLRFQAEHTATFDEIRAVLQDPLRPIQDARNLVTDKERKERRSWMLFERLEELGSESRAKLTEHYSNYIRAVQACLGAVSGQYPVTIAFYSGLEDELRHVVEQVAAVPSEYGDVTSTPPRSDALKRVDDLLLRFQEYCTNVEMAYLQLRKDSLV